MSDFIPTITERSNLIGAIRELCAFDGSASFEGDLFFQNYEAGLIKYEVDQFIVSFFLKCSPRFSPNRPLVEKFVYTGELSIGRKCETTTESILDETFRQKYDRRLKECFDYLVSILGRLSCHYGISITDCTCDYTLNRFDENIDFVVSNITIEWE